MCEPTSQAGSSQPRDRGRAWTLPAASVWTWQPAASACAMTYDRASAHAGEKVGRVAPLPGVSVQRAIAAMSVRILSTFTDMGDQPAAEPLGSRLRARLLAELRAPLGAGLLHRTLARGPAQPVELRHAQRPLLHPVA